MRRSLFAAVVLSLFLACVSAAAEKTPREFQSIPPLMAMIDGEPRIVCTAFSIHERLRLWMTAAHCGMAPPPFTILGEEAKAVVVDMKLDIVILQTPRVSAPALPLAKTAPKFKAPIESPGYPLGIRYYAVGTVGNPDVLFPHGPQPERHRLLASLVGTRGHSGAPVLNKRGEVVSVIQVVGGGTGYGSLMGGITWRGLREFARYFESEQEKFELPGEHGERVDMFKRPER